MLDDVADGHADEDRAGRLAVLLLRPGHPGDAEPHVGLQQRPDTARHRLGGDGTDDRAARHAQEFELHLGGVAHDPSAEPRRRPRDVHQATGDQPAGDGLGDRQRLVAREHPGGDGVLHRLVVDPEDDVAELLLDEGANERLLVDEQTRGVRGVVAARGESDLDALDARGEEGDRHAPVARQGLEALAHGLGETGLARPPRAQHPTRDHRGLPRVALTGQEVGQDRAFEHVGHLVGHAGHGVDHLLAYRADQSRRRAAGLGDDRGATGNVGLEQVVLGHRAPPRPEHRADCRHDLLVALEGHVHHLGERRAGDVVLSRPESAADDDRVAARERGAKRQHDALVVVADVLVEVRADPVRRELLAEPLRVRVGDLAEQQLRADRDDLNPHGRPLVCRRRSTATPCRSSGPSRSRSW